MEYEVFFVVNGNKLTKNPCSGESFDGIFCYRNGHQVSNPKEATPYYTHNGAQALVNKLNKSGIACPAWARKYKNKPNELGKYRIIPGKVKIDL